MTLLMFECYRKDFVLATCDTRYIIKYINNVTWESGEKFIGEDIFDKVEPLTFHTLMAIGGFTSIGYMWKDFMKKHAKPDYYLDECKEIFREAYAFLAKNKQQDAILSKYLDSEFVGTYLIGFYKDGSTGFLGWNNGELVERKCNADQEFRHMFAPSEDILNKSEQLLDYSKSPIINDNMLDTIRNHFAIVHSLVAKVHPMEVSSRFLSFALAKYEEDNTILIKTDDDLRNIYPFLFEETQSV